MKKLILAGVLLFSSVGFSQTDTTRWLRAFPVTDYIKDLNDSVKLVQLEMPEGIILKDKQLGLIKGVYNNSKSDTVQKGYGRCNLIKGNYYYFTIGNNLSNEKIKAGDLLYTFIEKTAIYYGQIPKLAVHFIQLQNVYETPLYDRYLIFNDWTKQKENALIDSMVADIKFTGTYFLQNNSSIDKAVTEGQFKGQNTLQVMTKCRSQNVIDFIDYVIARPRLYAGRQWKISEVFATWVSEGAPTVIRQ